VNASRTDRQILAIGLSAFKHGERFDHWPLHITLVPWFCDATQRHLSRKLEELSETFKPITVSVGKQALFGAHHDIPVSLIESSRNLQRLHVAALKMVYYSGAELDDPSYVNYKYRPHISTRHNEILAEQYVLDNLALVRDLGQNERQVEKVVRFRNDETTA